MAATFTSVIPTGHLSAGLIGLAANIVVIAVIEVGLRLAPAGRPTLAAGAAADKP